jgi:hypothetical protein
MKKGDRFIYYGKGEVFKGKVDRVTEKSAYDIINGVKIVREYVVSDEGRKFDRRDCRKIKSDLSLNFIKKIRNILN